MGNYRNISSQAVVYDVTRLFRESNWYEDVTHIILGGIQRIGLNLSTIDAHTPDDSLIAVSNHRALPPCDMEELTMIDYDGNRLCYNRDKTMLALSCDDFTWNKTNYGNWYTFTKDGKIRTSFESGNIKVFYKKFQMDDDGFYLIPDEYYYKSALRFHIIQELILEGYKMNISGMSFDYAEDKADRYATKARSRHNQMSRDKLEAFASMQTSQKMQFNRARFQL